MITYHKLTLYGFICICFVILSIIASSPTNFVTAQTETCDDVNFDSFTYITGATNDERAHYIEFNTIIEASMGYIPSKLELRLIPVNSAFKPVQNQSNIIKLYTTILPQSKLKITLAESLETKPSTINTIPRGILFQLQLSSGHCTRLLTDKYFYQPCEIEGQFGSLCQYSIQLPIHEKAFDLLTDPNDSLRYASDAQIQYIIRNSHSINNTTLLPRLIDESLSVEILATSKSDTTVSSYLTSLSFQEIDMIYYVGFNGLDPSSDEEFFLTINLFQGRVHITIPQSTFTYEYATCMTPCSLPGIATIPTKDTMCSLPSTTKCTCQDGFYGTSCNNYAQPATCYVIDVNNNQLIPIRVSSGSDIHVEADDVTVDSETNNRLIFVSKSSAAVSITTSTIKITSSSNNYFIPFNPTIIFNNECPVQMVGNGLMYFIPFPNGQPGYIQSQLYVQGNPIAVGYYSQTTSSTPLSSSMFMYYNTPPVMSAGLVFKSGIIDYTLATTSLDEPTNISFSFNNTSGDRILTTLQIAPSCLNTHSPYTLIDFDTSVMPNRARCIYSGSLSALEIPPNDYYRPIPVWDNTEKYNEIPIYNFYYGQKIRFNRSPNDASISTAIYLTLTSVVNGVVSHFHHEYDYTTSTFQLGYRVNINNNIINTNEIDIDTYHWFTTLPSRTFTASFSTRRDGSNIYYISKQFTNNFIVHTTCDYIQTRSRQEIQTSSSDGQNIELCSANIISNSHNTCNVLTYMQYEIAQTTNESIDGEICVCSGLYFGIGCQYKYELPTRLIRNNDYYFAVPNSFAPNHTIKIRYGNGESWTIVDLICLNQGTADYIFKCQLTPIDGNDEIVPFWDAFNNVADINTYTFELHYLNSAGNSMGYQSLTPYNNDCDALQQGQDNCLHVIDQNSSCSINTSSWNFVENRFTTFNCACKYGLIDNACTLTSIQVNNDESTDAISLFQYPISWITQRVPLDSNIPGTAWANIIKQPLYPMMFQFKLYLNINGHGLSLSEFFNEITSTTPYITLQTITNHIPQQSILTYQIPEYFTSTILQLPQFTTQLNNVYILMEPTIPLEKRNDDDFPPGFRQFLIDNISYTHALFNIPIISPCVKNQGTFNNELKKCDCITGYSGIHCELLPSTTQIVTCPLQCPLNMKPSADCLRCVCTNTQCERSVRQTMLYFNPKIITETTTLIDSTIITPKLLPYILSSIINTELQLNTLPPTVYNEFGSSNIIFNNTNYSLLIHIQEITPNSNDLHLYILTITCKDYTSTLSTDDLITTTVLTTFQHWLQDNVSTSQIKSNQYITQYLEHSDYQTQINGINNIKFYTPLQSSNNLITRCSLPNNPLQTAPCPSLAYRTSPYWDQTQCNNADVTLQMKTLLPTCLDLNNVSWTSTIWCKSYPQYPIVTSIPCNINVNNNNNDGTTGPTNGTISFKYDLAGPFTAGDYISIDWDYQSTATFYTVEIYLTNVNFKSSQFNMVSFDDGDDNNNNYEDNDDIIYNENNNYEQFNILQSTTPVYSKLLGSFAAIGGTGTIRIPPTTLPTKEAKLRLIVTQNIDIKTISNNIEITPINLCDDIKQCQLNASCQPSTGECQPNIGYIWEPHQELIEDTYIKKTQRTCATTCLNNGQCVDNYNSKGQIIGSRCDCGNNGYNGKLCQHSNSCTTSDKQLCGLYGSQTFFNQQCINECQCDNGYFTIDSNIITGITNTKCNNCELLDTFCDKSGTNTTLTYTSGCNECICKQGHIGDKCEFLSFYGVVYFTTTTPIVPITVTSIQEQKQQYFSFSTLFNSLLWSTQDDNTNIDDDNNSSTSEFQSNLDLVTPDGIIIAEQDVALSLGLPSSQVKLVGIIPTTTSPDNSTTTSQSLDSIIYYNNAIFAIASGTPSSSLESISSFNILQTTPTSDKPDIISLYSTWSNLKNSSSHLPVAITETQQEMGQFQGVTAAYDPNCKNNCPTGNDPFKLGVVSGQDEPPKKRNIGAIIGIIIGIIVGVILIFVITILATCYCKKNEKCCFDKHKNNKSNNSSRTDVEFSHASTQTSRDRSWTDYSANNNNNNNNRGIALSTTTSQQQQPTSRKQSQTVTPNSPSNGSNLLSSTKDSEEILDHGENLPNGWTKQRHLQTGQIFYVNTEQMKSQKHSPNDVVHDTTGW